MNIKNNLELNSELAYSIIMAEKETKQDSGKSTQQKESFFQSIFSSLFKASNPEAEKKRKLKLIAKNISKTKFHNFYKPGSVEMLAPFGKFMFDLYKAISQAQIMFKNTQNPAVFNRQIVNFSLSEHQLALLEELDEKNIIEQTKTKNVLQVQKEFEQKLQDFRNEFDSTRAAKAENLSKAFSLFKDFCCFDYYMVLKKYDASYQEFSFDAVPRLDKINAEYIVDDLKDFLTVAYAITDDTIAWSDLFEMIKSTQNRDLVSPGNWKKIVARIKSIQLSKSLDYIIQHISQDPSYETHVKYSVPSILEPFMDQIENETRNLLSKIETDQKEAKSSSICMQIFGSANPQSMKYYVPAYNTVLEKKSLNILEYAEPLNYLKVFLLEFVKTVIREFYDVVVIRGQWDATLSAPMSNAYQELLKASDEITRFDDNFADDGAFGQKIKTLLPKTAHDAGAENIINRVIADANDLARGYIIQATQNLITIGKTIKQLIEDYALPKPVLVQNWKELEKFIETPMKEFSVNIYKKIYLFVQLMQTYIQ
ncbi:MAG: hypothetical protein K6A89_10115 [Treponema sp.]|nr:hypothetical protein [Treponema sp.]